MTVNSLRDDYAHRQMKNCRSLMYLVSQIKFFKTYFETLNEEDVQYMLARKLKYEYIPKGNPIRKALTESNRMYFIMVGKAVCSFPSAG